MEVYGSKHSLFPRIWLVEAVGIGANNSEFITPFLAIMSLRAAQSHRPEGVTPHMSGWRTPYNWTDNSAVSKTDLSNEHLRYCNLQWNWITKIQILWMHFKEPSTVHMSHYITKIQIHYFITNLTNGTASICLIGALFLC